MSLEDIQKSILDALLQGGVPPEGVVNREGFTLASRLVWKLRFERLLRGSVDCARSFERDPKEFTALFRRYHRRVPPTAYYPADEARLFREWLA